MIVEFRRLSHRSVKKSHNDARRARPSRAYTRTTTARNPRFPLVHSVCFPRINRDAPSNEIDDVYGSAQIKLSVLTGSQRKACRSRAYNFAPRENI